MSQFEDRERAEEARYALDQTVQFRINNRRNRLLGEWAADLMGLQAEAVADYAKSVVRSDLEEAGEEDVFRKVRADLSAANIAVTDAGLREQMAALLATARDQIMDEIKAAD
jgi:hypothetical protein